MFFIIAIILGVMAWLLFRIDNKLRIIGDMIHDANKREESKRLN